MRPVIADVQIKRTCVVAFDEGDRSAGLDIDPEILRHQNGFDLGFQVAALQ